MVAQVAALLREMSMARFAPLKATLTDYAEDIAWHGMGLVHGLFDLMVVVAFGMAVYATGLGPEAAVDVPVAQAWTGHAPLACVTVGDCITATVLMPQNG